MSGFDNQCAVVRSLIGDARLVAPYDGEMVEVSAEDYEELVRDLAYGLMVKGYRRGDNILVSTESQDMFNFVDAACRLAHLNAVKTNLVGDQSSLSDEGVNYLIMLGRTWSCKYKSLVDRTIREICG